MGIFQDSVQLSNNKPQQTLLILLCNNQHLSFVEGVERNEEIEEEPRANFNGNEELNKQIDEIHGDWLIVTRKKKNQNQSKQGFKKNNYSTGNEKPAGKRQSYVPKGKAMGSDLKEVIDPQRASVGIGDGNKSWVSKKKRRYEGGESSNV